MTKREYLILELLISNPNKVFTKNNIYESVWNEEFVGEDNAVNVHIYSSVAAIDFRKIFCP